VRDEGFPHRAERGQMYDLRQNLLMIAAMDCSATTFHSSHEDDGDESDASVSTSGMMGV